MPAQRTSGRAQRHDLRVRAGVPQLHSLAKSPPEDLAAGDLRTEGAGVTAVALDVTEDAAPQRLVDTALERYGRLDIVLNNAGIIQVGPIQADTAEQVQAALGSRCSVPGVPGLACWPPRPAGAARPARLAAGWFPPAAPGRA